MSTISESTKATKVAGYSLLFVSDRERGRRVALPATKPIVLGRCVEADCHLDDSLASRRHAQISLQGNQVVVEDLESTNGTFVNGKKVRRTVLQPGDRVLIGACNMELSVEAEVAEVKPLSIADTKPLPIISADGKTIEEALTAIA